MPPKKKAAKAKKQDESKWAEAQRKNSGGTNKYLMGLAHLLGVDDENDDPYDDERHDPAGFTKDYLQRSTLHGLQYVQYSVILNEVGRQSQVCMTSRLDLVRLFNSTCLYP